MSYEVVDFASEVIERSHSIPVLVDFWAEWCGPCKVLGPTLERLAAKSNGRWALAKVDTDKYPDLAATYGVRGIPNVKLFVDGAMLDEFTGALPEQAVVRWLEKALPDPFRHEIEKAEALIHAGSAGQARQILEDLLKKDSVNERARVVLAGTYLYGDREKALHLIGDIEEHSEHFAEVDALRTIAGALQKAGTPAVFSEEPVKSTYLAAIGDLALQKFDDALQKFIEVIRSNRYYDDDGARKICIAIFKFLGEEHPVTRSRRRAFSSALNV
jgi:putative thioredoxin